MNRDTIFISHATPDDNDFVRWLGTRLTGHGYKVWADLFELKGGTPFWNSIEEALRHHACKVIFVVSRKSIEPERSGVRNELSVADAMKKTLKDPGFIIPVRIDDAPFSDLPIQVHQLNAIDFSAGWGAKLVELLDTLETAKTPKSVEDERAEFEKWRGTMVRTAAIVEAGAERIVTNLLSVKMLPEHVSFFRHEADATLVSGLMKGSGIPHAIFFRQVICFADLPTMQEILGADAGVELRARVAFAEFLDGKVSATTAPLRDEARKIATHLLAQHIGRHLEDRGLKRYESSSGPCFYFPLGLIEKNKVGYTAASGRKTHKNVVGRSERNKVYWHLAMKVNVVLGDAPVVRFKPYVCFSEDGHIAIGDVKRTFAIRRRFCKNWWNRHWRQLQEAFSSFLAEGKDEVTLSLGPERLVLAGRLLELVAAYKMPGDFEILDEPDDPIEPDDDSDEAGEWDEREDPELDEAA
jgi:hypothetical protein